MLANLLPGIRDLRTPLAVGYVWLVVFWLWIPASAKHMPTHGVLGELAQLGQYVGATGLVAAASFCAYLMGTVSTPLNLPFVRLGAYLAHILTGHRRPIAGDRLRRLRFTDFWGPAITAWPDATMNELHTASNVKNGVMSTTGAIALRDFAESEIGAGRILPAKREDFINYLLWEVPRRKNAVLGRDPELFSTLDRLTSEYEFRVGISAPLAAFITTLAWRSSPFWLIGLVVVLALARSGVRRRVEAGDLMADVVRIGRIDVPVPSELQPQLTLPEQDKGREPTMGMTAPTT